MAEQFGEKTHDATPHRRQKAREEGQVARSQDLSSALMLLGATLTLMYLGGNLAGYFHQLTTHQLGGEPWLQTDISSFTASWNTTLFHLAGAILPIFGLMLLAGVVVHLGQVGILFVPGKLAPDFDRVNPLSGARRLFSMSSAVRLGLGIFKIAVVVGVAAVCVQQHYPTILSLSSRAVPEIAAIVVNILLDTCLKIGLALLVLALVDYGFQRWKYEQDLRMTNQEIREEMKMLQGDPQLIAHRRQVQRQLVLNRLQNSVPTADFVVTNPTELAIAIKYDPQTMAAPVVVAKGAGLLAQRIRRLALDHGIPIVERKPLARVLYQQVDVNQPIPAEQYTAVAEVLRYVYQLQGKTLPGQQAA